MPQSAVNHGARGLGASQAMNTANAIQASQPTMAVEVIQQLEQILELFGSSTERLRQMRDRSTGSCPESASEKETGQPNSVMAQIAYRLKQLQRVGQMQVGYVADLERVI